MKKHYSLDTVEMTLRKLKWTTIQGMNPQLEIWVPSEDAEVAVENSSDDAAVFVPIDTAAPDFNKQLTRAIYQLTEFSSGNVFEELDLADLRISKQLDEFQLHVEGPEVKEGVVGWQQGVDLINGAKQILIAGAKSTRDYRRHFANAESTIAKSFIESCYMGQTQVGSYVVSALIPSAKEIETTKSKARKISTSVKGRDVTQTLISALQASHAVLEDYKKTQDSEVFEWGMTQGVSVEILRGIQNIIGEGETEVSVDFSPLDSPVEEPLTRVVNFTPDLKKAALSGEKILSKAPQPKRIRVTGEVTSLARRYDDPNSARIKMRGLIGNKNRTFTAKLKDKDYQKALEAHDHQLMLMVVGKADGGVFIDVEKVIVTNAPVGLEQPSPPQVEQLQLG